MKLYKNASPYELLFTGHVIFAIIPYMHAKTVEKYFLFGLLFITFIFSFLIFSPFWIILILGACFAVVLYPIYKWLKKVKLSSSTSALVTVLLFISVLCIPLYSISSIIFEQSKNVYYGVISNGDAGMFLSSIGEKINSVLPEGTNFNPNQIAISSVSFLTSNIGNIFNFSISAVLSLILLLLALFYFLKDGEDWKNKIILLSPLSKENDEKILHKLSKTISGVIKGYVLIALIQGILMWIGLSLFGVPNAVFWGLVSAIAALIPPFGTGLVCVPAIIFLYATGHILPAVGLLIWGVIIMVFINNFLNPYIIGKRVEIPSFLILFSILGGIALLGPVGVLIGPITISMLNTLFSIYKSEINKNEIL